MIVKNEFKKSFTCIPNTRTQEHKNTRTTKCQTDNKHSRHKHSHNR